MLQKRLKNYEIWHTRPNQHKKQLNSSKFLYFRQLPDEAKEVINTNIREFEVKKAELDREVTTKFVQILIEHKNGNCSWEITLHFLLLCSVRIPSRLKDIKVKLFRLEKGTTHQMILSYWQRRCAWLWCKWLISHVVRDHSRKEFYSRISSKI